MTYIYVPGAYNTWYVAVSSSYLVLAGTWYNRTTTPLPYTSNTPWLSYAHASPPRHDDGMREGFNVGFPCRSACVFLQFAFIRLAPLPPRWRFAGDFLRSFALS